MVSRAVGNLKFKVRIGVQVARTATVARVLAIVKPRPHYVYRVYKSARLCDGCDADNGGT
jgi:hypothetical protein